MRASEPTTATAQAARVTVWDPVVRLGHWALVAAFATAYLSAEEEAGGPDALHVWGGYAVGALVVLRILWGFIGPQHARFADFVCGPIAALRHLIDMLVGRARRHLGHSPAGGAMVIALLVCLALTVVTGLVAYGERGKGPLAGGNGILVTDALADGGQAEHGTGVESSIGDLHGALANITLALVILHIMGVVLASIVYRENLVAAMINGKKRARL